MKRPIEVRFNDDKNRWDIWYLDTEEWLDGFFRSEDAAKLAAQQVRHEMKDDGASDLKPKTP